MSAIASLEDLLAVQEDLKKVQDSSPETYSAIAALIKKHRKVGYKNICKLLLGEATPQELKG
ncbi:MAG: hypothetical protein EHM28_10640 [Spirochaetaceae bacterium]|nr:MAG: hypothetical protein EHM28_10640 [Spirochaetaceae bacterium]